MDSQRTATGLLLSRAQARSSAAVAPAGARALPWVRRSLLLAALVGSLAGCSGEGEGEDVAGGGSGTAGRESAAAQALKEAKDLRTSCESQGLDKTYADDFGRAVETLRKAEDFLEDGEDGKGRNYSIRARNEFRKLLETAEEATAAAKKAEDTRKLAETARADADKLEAKVNAPMYYAQAVQAYDKGVAALKTGRLEAIQDSLRHFEDAQTAFRGAADTAVENRKFRSMAEAAKELMVSWKARGSENQADVKAIVQWQQAQQAEIAGDASFESGDFRGAAMQYNQASATYTRALESVVEAAELASIIQEQRVRQEEAEKRLAEQRERELAAQVKIQELKGTPTRVIVTGGIPPGTGVPGGTPGTDVAYVPPGASTCVDNLDHSLYPQLLDAEDEAFLRENLSHLSKVARYNPDTGGVILDYRNGEQLQAEIILGTTPRNHITFIDPMLQATGGREVPSGGEVTMIGNTSGRVLFPVPFRYRTRVTFKLEIQMMTGKADFGIIVANDGTGNYYRTNFADIGSFREAKPPVWKPGARPGSQANNWHLKTRPVRWVVELALEAADGPGAITAIHDVGAEGEFANKIQAKSLRDAGVVGVTWNDVRFKMTELEVCGYLDKAEAVRMLRRKLGIAKGTGNAAAGGGESKPGGEPTTPPGDGGDGAAKPGTGGGFDY